MREEPSDAGRRLLRAFRHTLGRPPAEGELEVATDLSAAVVAVPGDPESAKALLKVGGSPGPDTMPPAELAAMTSVANVLLNLNETITK